MPQFRWHPVATATSYRFLLADNSGFTGATTVPLTDTVYNPLVDLADGTWFWKVSCSINLEAYSPVDSVIIDSNVIGILINNTSAGQGVSFVLTNREVKIVLPNSNNRNITAHIYDIHGRQVAALDRTDNNTIMVWNFTNTQRKPVSCGVYIVRLVTPDRVYSQRVLVNR